LSQQVGPHNVGELTEYFLGPRRGPSRRDPALARAAAEAAGLEITDLRAERLRTVFYDVGAIIYFLRLVVWTVPDFSVEAYRDRLRELHHYIGRHGSFVAHASRKWRAEGCAVIRSPDGAFLKFAEGMFRARTGKDRAAA
jgi:hypothetical protein